MEEGVKKIIECSRCDHQWLTKSLNVLVTCPACRENVKNPYNKYEHEEEDEE